MFQKAKEKSSSLSVEVSETAWAKMMHWAHMAKGEVSGLAEIAFCEEGIKVVDAFLFKQKSSAASTVLSADSYATALSDLMTAGRNPGVLRVWWHSHGSIGASWSSTDENTINETFALARFRDAEFGGCDWVISICVDTYNKYVARFDMYRPVRLKCEVELTGGYELPENIKAQADKEFKENVTEETFHSFKGGTSFAGGYDGSFNLDEFYYVRGYGGRQTDLGFGGGGHVHSTKTPTKEKEEHLYFETIQSVVLKELPKKPELTYAGQLVCLECISCGKVDWYKAYDYLKADTILCTGCKKDMADHLKVVSWN